MTPYVTDELLHAVGSFEAGWRVLDTFAALPERFREPVKSRFSRAARDGGQAAAIRYIAQVETDLTGSALSLDATDAEICDYASERAREVRSLLMAQVGAGSANDLRSVLVGYCQEFGATVKKDMALAGMCGRMTEPAWWRRQVRRNHARTVEAHAISLGFVHRRAGLYASDESVKRSGEQQARNHAALQQTEATNEEGLTMTLAELSAVSVSNPRLRRGELMTRIAGFEGCAKASGHIGMFYTATAPSRMHPRLAKTGQENPKYPTDGTGVTPKECAAYLAKTWARARAWLHRRGINIYGFRVAEPHHDGTPHWHMLFFMLPAVVESVTACLKKYFCEADAHELNTAEAQGARFNAKQIDWSRGSAAGYISKYIAKNIDGARNDQSCVGQVFDDTEDGRQIEVADSAKETAPRVLAWSSTWGIRQFQQIGGPGVTVWRELRRIRDMKQGDLFDTWSAADTGNWQAFTERQGGAVCARKDRPLQLWSEAVPGKTNRYGEPAGKEILGVQLVKRLLPVVRRVNYETRRHVWEIRRKSCSSSEKKTTNVISGSGEGAFLGCRSISSGAIAGKSHGFDFGRASGPWSPVNNCTPLKDADGFAVGEFAGQDDPPDVSAAWADKIKAAQVAAVLANISSKRKRGGFGQFPRLNFPTGQEANNATSNS